MKNNTEPKSLCQKMQRPAGNRLERDEILQDYKTIFTSVDVCSSVFCYNDFILHSSVRQLNQLRSYQTLISLSTYQKLGQVFRWILGRDLSGQDLITFVSFLARKT